MAPQTTYRNVFTIHTPASLDTVLRLLSAVGRGNDPYAPVGVPDLVVVVDAFGDDKRLIVAAPVDDEPVESDGTGLLDAQAEQIRRLNEQCNVFIAGLEKRSWLLRRAALALNGATDGSGIRELLKEIEDLEARDDY